MFVEQAMAADLARLDAETQRLRDQRAEMENQRAGIDSQLAKNEEEADPLRSYFALRRKYEKALSQQEADGPASTTAVVSDTVNDKTLSRRVAGLAVDLIRAEGRPMHTRDLLPQLAQRGLDVGGKNPVANLSGYLCRDKKRLVNSRKLGWGLVEWGDNPPPNDPPRKRTRHRNDRQTKKAAQDQQGRTAV